MTMKGLFGAAAVGLNENGGKSSGKRFRLPVVLAAVAAVAVPGWTIAEQDAVTPALEAAAQGAVSVNSVYLERGGDIEANIAKADAENEELSIKLVAGGNDSDPADLCVETAWAGVDVVAQAGEGC